jgi:hypothetical protein
MAMEECFLRVSSVSLANYNSTIAQYSSIPLPPRCAITLTRQHVITSPILNSDPALGCLQGKEIFFLNVGETNKQTATKAEHLTEEG